MADQMPFGSFLPTAEQPQQAPLTSADMYAFIRRDPRLLSAFLSSFPPKTNWPDRSGAILQDAAENAFGGTQSMLPNDIRRFLGAELTPKERIADTFMTLRGVGPLSVGRGSRFTPMGGQ